MLAELREGYDAATRGDFDVDGWKEKIRPDQILQLGMPCADCCWVHEPEGDHRAASPVGGAGTRKGTLSPYTVTERL